MFKRRLARDLSKLLTFKLVALAALYALFFAPSHRAAIDPALHIGGDPASAPTQPPNR